MVSVAIVGRPNVGKSTLFNRLAGRKLAIVHNRPGVTRDWRDCEVTVDGKKLTVVDTAGLEESFNETVEGMMRASTEGVISSVDHVLFVIDARAGLTSVDEHFAQWIRKTGKDVTILANKHEGNAAFPGYLEAFSLGMGEPLSISAEHGLGMSELFELFAEWVEKEPEEEEVPDLPEIEIEVHEGEEESTQIYAEVDRSKPVQIAVVGRPNVGKSTLVNALFGEERMITGPQAGLTRDSISVFFETQDRTVRLFDTAGLRRQAKITDSVEKLSVSDSLRAVRFAQVVILVVDPEDLLDKQDLTIARRVVEEGRALIIAINKWDTVDEHKAVLQRLNDRLATSMPQVRGIPTLSISALHGKNLDKLLTTAFDLFETWSTHIGTSLLNRWLEEKLEQHTPPLVNGRRVKIRYMNQAKIRPPTFVLFGNQLADLPESYSRYLINAMREDFNLPGTPIRYILRKGKNPYSGRVN